jgi:putative ABC transport system permease protein
VLHSFWKMSHIDLGFNGDHVLTGFLGPSASTDLRNFKLPPPEQTVSVNRAVLARLQSLPGVSSAGLSTSFPLQEHGTVPVAVSGAATDNPQRLTAGMQWITPGYQQTFQIRLARGRLLNDSDRLGNPLSVVVNETLVRRYLLGADPLTQRLMIPLFRMGPGPPPAPQAYQIVGVVHDVADREHLTDAPQPEVFLSFWQTPFPYAAFEVRTAEDPAIVSGELRHALSAFPNLSVERVQAMQVAVENQFISDRFETVLFAGFAAAALLLAAVGIYGVMAFSVTQRSHEIGLRIALGSPRPDVVRLMLRGGMRLALIGMVFGIGGAFLVGRLMQSTLYGVGAVDPGSLAGVGAILITVAMLACWIPARRAATIEPMRALRSE